MCKYDKHAYRSAEPQSIQHDQMQPTKAVFPTKDTQDMLHMEWTDKYMFSKQMRESYQHCLHEFQQRLIESQNIEQSTTHHKYLSLCCLPCWSSQALLDGLPRLFLSAWLIASGHVVPCWSSQALLDAHVQTNGVMFQQSFRMRSNKRMG